MYVCMYVCIYIYIYIYICTVIMMQETTCHIYSNNVCVGNWSNQLSYHGIHQAYCNIQGFKSFWTDNGRNHLSRGEKHRLVDSGTPSPPTKSFDFRGFDSGRLLILRGGNPHVRGIYRESPGKFDSRTLSRETLSRWTGRRLLPAWLAHWLTAWSILAVWNSTKEMSAPHGELSKFDVDKWVRPLGTFTCEKHFEVNVVTFQLLPTVFMRTDCTCLMRPRLFDVCFIMSRIINICRIILKFWKTRALDK